MNGGDRGQGRTIDGIEHAVNAFKEFANPPLTASAFCISCER